MSNFQEQIKVLNYIVHSTQKEEERKNERRKKEIISQTMRTTLINPWADSKYALFYYDA